MERLSSFDCETELNAYAEKVSEIAEMYRGSSARIKKFIADGTRDYSERYDRNSIIFSTFVAPLKKMLDKNYSEEFIVTCPSWMFGYAAEFNGTEEEFKEFMKASGITENTFFAKAEEMVKAGVYGIDFELYKLDGYKEFLNYLPKWVQTDEQKVEYVKTVWIKNAPLWYVAALQKMKVENFNEIKDFNGDKILGLRLAPLFSKDPSLKERKFGKCKYIWYHNSDYEDQVYPIYWWANTINYTVLRDCRVEEKEGVLFLNSGTGYVSDACLRGITDWDYPDDCADPVLDYILAMNKKFQIGEHFYEYDTLTMWKAIEHGQMDWWFWMKYPELFLSIRYRAGKSLTMCIIDKCYIGCGYLTELDKSLPFGLVVINDCEAEDVLVRFLKDSVGHSRVLDRRCRVGASMENAISFKQHLYAVSEWMQSNGK